MPKRKKQGEKKVNDLAKRLLPEWADDERVSDGQIEEIYRIDNSRLPEIIRKIKNFKEGEYRAYVFLRRNGLEIGGNYKLKGSAGNYSSGRAGFIANGAHFPDMGFERYDTTTYLVTFATTDPEAESGIEPNLLNLLREFLI